MGKEEEKLALSWRWQICDEWMASPGRLTRGFKALAVDGWKAVCYPCFIASGVRRAIFVRGGEFPTYCRPPFINRAIDALPDDSLKRHASGIFEVGTSHRAKELGDIHGHLGRHAARSIRIALAPVERRAIVSTASAACQAWILRVFNNCHSSCRFHQFFS